MRELRGSHTPILTLASPLACDYLLRPRRFDYLIAPGPPRAVAAAASSSPPPYR
jgi:hypothetical protein